MKILHIVGNRPQFIKLAPFLRATHMYQEIQNIILHSGQHYDYEMSRIFFEELGIAKIDYNLEVGSGTHGFQTGTILVKLDPILLKEKPDVVVVYGDTNTTLAGALAAYKLHFPVAHVEAGMREYIWRPEEMNKKMADHCANFCFCPIQRACLNLKREGIEPERIFFTGDITYDAFLMSKNIAMEKGSVEVPRENYILMTMHRAETVDVYERVKGVIEALLEIPMKIVYPIHPRTQKKLIEMGLYRHIEKANHIVLMEPIGYFEFLKLLLNSSLVITDSSGVIKEAFYAKKPCVTVDNTTEYTEVFDQGYNVLVGTKKESILAQIEKMFGKKFDPIDSRESPFGDGNAANKMVSILMEKIPQKFSRSHDQNSIPK